VDDKSNATFVLARQAPVGDARVIQDRFQLLQVPPR
jgi:hypothetical protein